MAYNYFVANTNAAPRAECGAAYNRCMRAVISMVSILVVLLASYGIYYVYLKQAAPTNGATPVQTIATTGVQMDLLSIAQAERMYNAQNGAYGSIEQLTSTGTMNINGGGRDGYSYSVDVTGEGFTVTARHEDVPVPSPGAAPLHYPTLSIDQNMQVRQSN
jgi:hypothetical protein